MVDLWGWSVRGVLLYLVQKKITETQNKRTIQHKEPLVGENVHIEGRVAKTKIPEICSREEYGCVLAHLGTNQGHGTSERKAANKTTTYLNKRWWMSGIPTLNRNLGIHHNIPRSCPALKASTLMGAYMLWGK